MYNESLKWFNYDFKLIVKKHLNDISNNLDQLNENNIFNNSEQLNENNILNNSDQLNENNILNNSEQSNNTTLQFGYDESINNEITPKKIIMPVIQKQCDNNQLFNNQFYNNQFYKTLDFNQNIDINTFKNNINNNLEIIDKINIYTEDDKYIKFIKNKFIMHDKFNLIKPSNYYE